MDKNEQTIQQGSEIQKKETFGVVQPKKSNTRKKVATAVVAGVVLATAIAVPIAIKVNQNNGYTVNIEYRLQGELNGTKSLNLKKGAKVGDIVAEQMAGYVFVGYCSDVNCLQPLDAETEITKDLTVYLHYVAINYSFASIPEGVKITTSAGDVTTNTKLNYGDEITVTYIIPAGHSVGNFKLTGVELISQQADVTEDNGDISRTATYKVVGNGTNAQSVILTAEFEAEANQYTVTFINEGETFATQTLIYNQNLSAVGEPIKASSAEKDYFFVGWSTDKNANPDDEFAFVDLSIIKTTSNITLYAIYKEATRDYVLTIESSTPECIEFYKYNTDMDTWKRLEELPTTFMYGEKVVVRYVETEGCKMKSFILQTGFKNTNMFAVLDDQTYTIYEVQGNTKVVYTEEEYLNFSLMSEGYAVSGLKMNDVTDVIIPSIYKGQPVVAISNSAFSSKSLLESVQIPNGVTMIGSYAFGNCTSLTNIAIPESVATIGSSAFSGCSSLTSITIPESVTSIGSYSFLNCKVLTEINYNAVSVTDLTDYSNVFGNVGLDSDGVIVTFGEKVTRIPACLFYASSSSYKSPNITNVTIGDSVVSIGNSAFRNCEALTDMRMSENVTTIGSSAFSGCLSLTSITIPEDVTSIGNYAFNNCKALTKINFNAISVTDLSFANGAFYYAGIDGKGIVASFGEKVTRIPAYLFSSPSSSYSPKLVSVLLGEGIISIGSNAFYGVTSLTSINISDGVTSIGSSAFRNCTSLTSINIPDNVTSIGSNAFNNCTNLISITIGAGVTSIGEDAFSKCTMLTQVNYNARSATLEKCIFINAGDLSSGITVNIGNNVKDIPASLFSDTWGGSIHGGPPKITSINIPSSVTSVGSWAFYNSSGFLINLTIDSEYVYKNAIGNFRGAKNIHILKSIDDNSSTYLTNNYKLYNKIDGYNTYSKATYDIDEQGIMYAEIDGGLSVVGYMGTSDSLIIPSTYNRLPVIEIGSKINPSLINVVISEGVTRIGSYAFSNCTKLTNINIPDSVESIGQGAFEYCSGLTSIVIPSGVTSIELWTFQYCTSLTSLILPDTLTTIMNNAFYHCAKLTSIDIPSSVTTIGSSVFFGSGLTKINYLGTAMQWLGVNEPTDKTSYYKKLYINGIDYDTAMADYLIDEIVLPEGVTRIGAYKFYDRKDIISIIMPEGITSIGSNAFYGCTGITSITIPEGITSIGSNAFYGCTKLTEIKFNAIAITDIHNLSNIFYNAGVDGEGINVIFGENVTQIQIGRAHV